MRLLQIILIAFISLTISVNYSDSAAATGAKTSKSSWHRGHKSHGRSKGKKRASKTGVGNVWDRIRMGIRIPRPTPAFAEYDQILAGKSKNPSAAASGSIKTTGTVHSHDNESARLTTVIAPKKLNRGQSQLPDKLRGRQMLSPQKSSQNKMGLSTTNKYTRLGRLKFGLKESSTSLAERFNKARITSNEKIASTKNDSLFKSSSVQRIRTRLGLYPDLYNHGYERVSRHIAGYSQRKGYLYQVSERARPYLYHIVDALSKHNLPLDLALLPIVESAYQPTALSNKAAAGIWQFIPSTGLEYGLEQNDEYDARLDITASTHAAIRFLSGLNGHFRGDWLLSLAAYNCGQGAVDAAISRNQAEGLPTDFWSLDLPAETKDYVPRLLALSAIFASPSSYGLKLRSVRNEPYFIKVNIDRATDINHLANKELRTVAKLADFDPGQFGLLNTAYINSTLPGNKPFTLLMPISNANLLHQSLAFMAQPYKEEKKIAPSLLAELALPGEPSEPKIQVSLLSLSINQDQQWALSKGQFREFNVKPKSTEEIVTAKSTDDDYWAVHYLEKGESLQDVAESHGITEEVLRVANKFKGRQNITLGQRLLVPIKQMVAAAMKKTRTSVLFRGI